MEEPDLNENFEDIIKMFEPLFEVLKPKVEEEETDETFV